MKIVFLGSGDIGLPSFRALAGSETHKLLAAVTQPDRPAGRSMRPRPSPIKLAAQEFEIPVLQPEKVRAAETLDQMRALDADVFVVAAYGQILPKAILEMPRLGCINLHASLLPRHRGASPVHAAILAGDALSGMTVMWVAEGLDTGDILLARECRIGPEDTAGTLHDRLASLAPEALLEALELISGGRAPSIPQDNARATYAPKISKSDGEIDWSLPAEEIARRIRGLHPWPGTFTRLPDGKTLKIHRAAARGGDTGALPGSARAESGAIFVSAGSGKIELLEVQAEGGKRLPAADFLRGHPLPPGCVFGGPADQQ